MNHSRRLLSVLAALAFCALAAPAAAEIGAFKLADWQAEVAPGSVVLADLEIEVEVVSGFATVKLRQVFENRSPRALEGAYFLRLPPEAVLMSFGVWDDGRWTEAVVIERREGRKAYQEIVSRMVDPALLEAPEAELTDAFKVSVAPIPAYGSRRVEISFHQWLPIRSGRREFILPLKPGPALAPERAWHCRFQVTVRDASPFGPVTADAPGAVNLVGETRASGAGAEWQAEFTGGPVALDRDLVLSIPVPADQSRLSILAYRDPDTEVLDISPFGGKTYRDDRGYFLAEAFLNLGGDTAAPAPPRDLAILFDTSLSMGFEKLEKAYQVLERVLASLRPADRFTLIAMDRAPRVWRPRPAAADPAAIGAALEFARRSPLAAGTDLTQGFLAAIGSLAPAPPGRKLLLVAITDGQASRNEVRPDRVAAAVLKADAGGVRLHAFGIGEDVNAALLARLADGSAGYFLWGRETEDLEPKLASFLAALGREPARGLSLKLPAAAGANLVYPAAAQSGFHLESRTWVGRYRSPLAAAAFELTGEAGGRPLSIAAAADLPESAPANAFIPRLWAERRVEALLDQIRAEGERPELVEEIVDLSRRFKFPTPYTSYLVAPRAFLRPRFIRPHDPILEVQTEPGARSVLAIFPFGELHRLRYLPDRDRWETRFIVPGWMKDGRYHCRLVIVDAAGKRRMEEKEFIVDSSPPRLFIRLGAAPRPGGRLELMVDADPDTRSIRAGLGSLPAVEVRWDPAARVCRGFIPIPAAWPAGEYTLRVYASDFAANVSARELAVRIGG